MLPREVFPIIFQHCDAQTLLSCTSVSKATSEASSTDALWESLFLKDRRKAGCYVVASDHTPLANDQEAEESYGSAVSPTTAELVDAPEPPTHHKWKTFYLKTNNDLCFYDSLDQAISLSEPHSTILVTPLGAASEQSSIYISKPVHIIGVGYNRRFNNVDTANWLSSDAVVQQSMLEVSHDTVILRHVVISVYREASGGSLSNITLLHDDVSRSNDYLFDIHECKFRLENVRICNKRFGGVMVHSKAELTLIRCDLCFCEVFAINQEHKSLVVARRSLLRHCGSNCVETYGVLKMENCVIFGSRFNGLSALKQSQVRLDSTNLINNSLNGAEVQAGADFAMVNCAVRSNKLNGLVKWSSDAEFDAQAFERATLVHNSFQENVVSAVCCRVVPDPDANLAKLAITRGVCTFSLTGPHFVRQPWYDCHDCELTGNGGICEVCAMIHRERGHHIQKKWGGEALCYCDCPITKRCNCLFTAEGAEGLGVKKLSKV